MPPTRVTDSQVETDMDATVPTSSRPSSPEIEDLLFEQISTRPSSPDIDDLISSPLSSAAIDSRPPSPG